MSLTLMLRTSWKQKEAEELEKQKIDPQQIMLADIDQRREASHLKDDEAKLRAETEAFKAQLKYESDMEKIESEYSAKSDKNEVDLTIAEMKQPQGY